MAKVVDNGGFCPIPHHFCLTPTLRVAIFLNIFVVMVVAIHGAAYPLHKLHVIWISMKDGDVPGQGWFVGKVMAYDKWFKVLYEDYAFVRDCAGHDVGQRRT
jgi:hypothetical protein